MKMKAAFMENYGPPEALKIKEIEKPIPKENEVLIHIHATTVTKFDSWMRSCTAPPGFGFLSRVANGWKKPKNPILGTDLSGEIEEIGDNVKNLKKGDQVYGFTGMKMGTYAEYICLPEDSAIAIKPKNMTYEEAAAVPQGALTALYFLKMGNIKEGQKVLIFGASGGIGLFAVQLAKYLGAEVTGVCSTIKVDLVRSVGADKVIDYQKKDYTKKFEIYDVILDTIGMSPFSSCQKSLSKEGYYIYATFGLPRFLRMAWLNLTSKKKAKSGLLEESSEDLVFLKELIEQGKMKVIIGGSFSLEKIADAHRYFDTGKRIGNIVIVMA